MGMGKWRDGVMEGWMGWIYGGMGMEWGWNGGMEWQQQASKSRAQREQLDRRKLEPKVLRRVARYAQKNKLSRKEGAPCEDDGESISMSHSCEVHTETNPASNSDSR